MENAIRRPRLKLPAKGAVGYTATNLIIKSIGMLTTPFFTRLLGAAEFGRYSLYMSVLGVLSVSLSAFFSSGVIYRGLQHYEHKNHSFLLSGIGVGVVVCLLICPLLFAILPNLGLDSGFAPIICLQVLLDAVVALKCAELRYGYKYRAVAFIGLCSAVLSPVLGASLILGAEMSYTGRIYGVLLASAIVAVPILSITVRRGRASAEMCKYIVKNASPLLPHTASGAMWGQLDKLLISSILGVSALAKYSVAHSLGIALTLLTSGVSSALLPWMMRKLAAGRTDTVRTISGGVFSALGCGILLVIGLAPEMMSLLAPIEYADAVEAVAPIALSTLPAFAVSIFAFGAVFHCKSGLTVIPTLAGVLSSYLLCLFLLPRLDFLGAGVSLLLSELISLSTCLLLSERVGGDILIERRVILRSFLSTLVFGAALVSFYSFLPARLLLLTVPTVLALRELFDMRRLAIE